MVRRLLVVLAAASALALSSVGVAAPAAQAESYVPISGAGSTWAQNAIEQWRKNVNQYGLRVNYAGTGSSDGRNQFRNGTVDFAVSDIPYGLTDGGITDLAPTRGYTYIPIVGGGTSFMYNLKIGGTRVTQLRLSGSSIAKIFTRGITSWADPQIAAENPGLTLPDIPVVPVVRGDGAGSTAQFTAWLASQHTAVWDAHCVAAGRTLVDGHCGTTSIFPTTTGYLVQAGSLGTAGYVSQDSSEGTITYVEYSYALNAGFPAAKLLNSAGYYVSPAPQAVSVALLDATVRDDVPEDDPAFGTSDLTGVWTSADPRAYPLSSYSYLIAPTATDDKFTTESGKSLGAFANYFLCEGQQQAPRLGFGPLPMNLVQSGLAQVTRIPGVQAQNIDIAKCNNPTFSETGENTLAANAPMPPVCDKDGPLQCGTSKAALPAPVLTGAAQRFSTDPGLLLTWNAMTDVGATSYDVRWSSAGLTGAVTIHPITSTTKTRALFSIRPGQTVCAAVRARASGGSVGAWSAYRCQARPVDDRSLAGTGWLRTSRAGAFRDTVTRSTVAGKALSVRVTGSRLAVVATTCATCGKVRVYAGTTLVATLDLKSPSLRKQVVLPLPVLRPITRVLVLKVATSGRTVEIDGVATSRA